MKRVLEMGGDDNYTAMWIYFMMLNCMLKKFVQMVIFLLCVLYHNFLK